MSHRHPFTRPLALLIRASAAVGKALEEGNVRALPLDLGLAGVSMQNSTHNDPSAWGSPEPVTEEGERPPSLELPKLLPPELTWLGTYLTAVAGNIQTPIGLVAPLALACASAAASQAVIFHGRPGHIEVPSLWVAGGAAPGERKSATLHSISKPLRKRMYERKYKRSDFEEWLDSPENLNDNDPADFWKPKRKLRGGGSRNPPPAFISGEKRGEECQIITDASTAGLIDTLSNNLGRACLLSDEGSFIDRAITRRDESLDPYLKPWSGEDITVKRHRCTIHIPSPQLTIGLLVQPEVLRQLFSNRTLVQRGFTQRFLLSVPEPLPSRSYSSALEVPSELDFEWTSTLRKIDDLPRGGNAIPRAIHLSGAGMKAYSHHADYLNEQHSRNLCHPILAEWISKAHGQLLRISGLLTLLGNPEATEIDTPAVMAAAQWIEYFREHFRHHLIACNQLSPIQAQACRTLLWLKSNFMTKASRSQITQNLRCQGFQTADSWLPVFKLLVDKGWLRPGHNEPIGDKGGRPSHAFDINPALFEQEGRT